MYAQLVLITMLSERSGPDVMCIPGNRVMKRPRAEQNGDDRTPVPTRQR